MASKNTSNQTCENENDNQWPRFLIMEAADEKVPLNLNAFVLKKAIDGMANAELDNVKPMKSGSVFIEVETKQQCKNLLKTTKLLGYLPVKVSPHRTLNSSKFVIKCEELDKMDEEEIKKELQPQGIIAVKRISIQYSLYVLTIKGQTIPKRINIGYLKKETRPYIPNPQRCFQCQKFGHTKNSCKGKAVCAGCGEEGHNLDDCKNDPKCVNCPLNLNAFVLKKAIDGMANAELDNVKPMKSDSVFIEVETKQQCKNLLKTTKLLGYLPVKVSPHRTLNSSKFVIKCEELDKMDEEEIKKELQPQGIIAVKGISIRYSLYVLTIRGQTIPKRINIGYLKKETRPYIPNPQRCFQCQKFGHTKNSCKGKAVCAGCGEEGHNLDDCKNDPKCVNCQGDRVAISRDCPKWKIEKDIVTLKYTEKISFADARKRLQPSFDPSKDSYATVTQTPPQSSRPLPPWAKKIRLPIDFRTEIEYLKYILNYCLTRLDTLDEITPENPVPRVAPSSDETPPPPQTTPEQQNETTILNTESTLQSAASNDVNDENEIEMLTMSNKRTLNEDSSEEDTNNPLPAKKAATSSSASEQSGTRVPKGRGGGDLPKISAFPANAPQSRGRGSSQGDKSPARTPRFSNNTGEGTASSAQSGRNRGPINRNPPLKPPGTIKTATKDKTKSKGKNTNS